MKKGFHNKKGFNAPYFYAAANEIFRNAFVSLAFFVSFLGDAKKKE